MTVVVTLPAYNKEGVTHLRSYASGSVGVVSIPRVGSFTQHAHLAEVTVGDGSAGLGVTLDITGETRGAASRLFRGGFPTALVVTEVCTTALVTRDNVRPLGQGAILPHVPLP